VWGLRYSGQGDRDSRARKRTVKKYSDERATCLGLVNKRLSQIFF